MALLCVSLLLTISAMNHKASLVYGQSSDQDDKYEHAKLLYSQGAYLSAREAFSSISSTSPLFQEARFYEASSAIKLGQQDAEALTDQFVLSFPDHLYAGLVLFEIGDYHYALENYEKALYYYNRCTQVDPNELNFKKGLTYSKSNQPDQAIASFEEIKPESKYYADAGYFAGFIHYDRKEYESAYFLLKRAFDSKDYADDALVLYVSSLHQAGQYKKLIELLDTMPDKKSQPEVLNCLADSYYQLGQFLLAEDSYKKLLEHEAYQTDQIYFKAGFSSYKVQHQDNAIQWLKVSAVADDTVGAYASYYLGVVYHEMGNMPFAATSFANTAKYKTKLKEEALYLFGKTNLEIPNYPMAIMALGDYRTTYPKGKYYTVVSDLLSTAYAHTDDYDLAMSYIEGLDKLTPLTKKIYQRVSFVKGKELFNQKKYQESIEAFQKSLIHDVDRALTQQTYFWTAEACTLQKDYNESVFFYSNVDRTNKAVYLKAQYGLGYAYFNLQDYINAIEPLQTAANGKGILTDKYISDAYLRIGDCNFALKKYEQGINSYLKAHAAGNAREDYINYQVGLLNRYRGQTTEARKYFKTLIKNTPESSLANHAAYQIAQMDFESGDDQKTIESLRNFLVKYPTSPFVPYAMVSQAVAYDNLGQKEESLENYKVIIERFPRHDAAKSALIALQNRHASGDFNEFNTYLTRYKQSNPNSEALENVEFESAKSSYFAQKYDLAIESLKSFLADYPKSALRTEAIYYLADANYRLENREEAIKHFEQINQIKDYDKHIKVLYRLAEIKSDLGQYKEGIKYYHQMNASSPSARYEVFIQRGLMSNHFALQRYDSALYYGKSLISLAQSNVQVEVYAKLIVGKSYFKQNEKDKALKYLQPLIKESPDDIGAEAAYTIAMLHRQSKDYKTALDGLFVMSQEFEHLEYWQAKAFLLMADIYIDTNETFQAKATLNSIIDNSNVEEVVKEAKNKLNTLKSEI